MQHSDFAIGTEFSTATGRWLCTDVGTRTIIAIKISDIYDTSWLNGPPYGVVETVFDEEVIVGARPCHHLERLAVQASSETAPQSFDLDPAGDEAL